VGLLLGLSSITVPWDTLILSVVLYIVVPMNRRSALEAYPGAPGRPSALNRTLHALAPLSSAPCC
jgi:arsenite transporter